MPDRPSAFSKIVRLLEVRERSVHELTKRLQEAGYSEEETVQAVNRAIECCLVDDERFATCLIRTRFRQGKGARAIEQELIANEIDPYSIEGWPDAFYDDDEESTELERAMCVLRSKPFHCKDIRQGAYRRLASKGFDPQICSEASWEYARALN